MDSMDVFKRNSLQPWDFGCFFNAFDTHYYTGACDSVLFNQIYILLCIYRDWEKRRPRRVYKKDEDSFQGIFIVLNTILNCSCYIFMNILFRVSSVSPSGNARYLNEQCAMR